MYTNGDPNGGSHGGSVGEPEHGQWGSHGNWSFSYYYRGSLGVKTHPHSQCSAVQWPSYHYSDDTAWRHGV